MKTEEIHVGDIVESKGYKYLVTNKNPLVGVKDYICVLTKDGLARDMWCQYVEKKVGHIDIESVLKELKV